MNFFYLETAKKGLESKPRRIRRDMKGFEFKRAAKQVGNMQSKAPWPQKIDDSHAHGNE